MSSSNSRPLLAWAFYDWGNSAYSAIIETFLFAAYFATSVAANQEVGSAYWGLSLAAAGVIIALTGPILGAFADKGGRRKSALALFTAISVIAIALMWFVRPSPDYTFLAMFLIFAAATASECASIFYNAMLPSLAPTDKIGRWSGWGWALGYAGGVCSLLIALLFIVPANATDNQVRLTFVFCALWYALFALPIFFFVPSEKTTSKLSFAQTVSSAFHELGDTFRHVRSHSNIFRFLIGRMLYMDALITLFAFGGIYASSVYGMTPHEVLLFGIGLNVTAGLGALIFAPLDDKFSAKTVIISSLIGLLITGAGTLLAPTKLAFALIGLSVGLFVGPAQASGRSYLARVAPTEIRHQMFGFFALSAKATAFLGPLLVSGLTFLTGSLPIGMGAILILIVLSLAVLRGIHKEL